MNKTWLVTEKILGLLVAVWGLFALYSVVSNITQTVNSGYLLTGKVTYESMARYNHLIIIISVIAVFGGTLLLFSEKSGWMLSVVATVIFGLMLFISARVNSGATTLTFYNSFKSYSLLSILFFLSFIVLLLKPFRQKYKPTSKNWLMITAIIGVLILDKIIF